MTETCFPFWTECLEIAFVDHANSTWNWSLSLTENFIQWREQSLPYSFHSESSPGTQTCSGQGGRELCGKELGRGQRWQTAQPMGCSDGRPHGQQGARSKFSVQSCMSCIANVFKVLKVFFFKHLQHSANNWTVPISGLSLQG